LQTTAADALLAANPRAPNAIKAAFGRIFIGFSFATRTEHFLGHLRRYGDRTARLVIGS
jgi:hypothetical protein